MLNICVLIYQKVVIRKSYLVFYYFFIILAEDLKKRPRLKLAPRTVKDPVNEVADKTQQLSIFGGAKPRDESKYEVKKDNTADDAAAADLQDGIT